MSIHTAKQLTQRAIVQGLRQQLQQLHQQMQQARRAGDWLLQAKLQGRIRRTVRQLMQS